MRCWTSGKVDSAGCDSTGSVATRWTLASNLYTVALSSSLLLERRLIPMEDRKDLREALAVDVTPVVCIESLGCNVTTAASFRDDDGDDGEVTLGEVTFLGGSGEPAAAALLGET